MVFLTHLLGGNCSQVLTPFSRQAIFPHPSKKTFKQTKEMTFDRRIANITGPLLQGLYCPSSRKLIKRPCMK